MQPAIAPDGRRLAFAVRGINADLWRLPVSPTTARPTGEPEPVVVTTRVESRGAWSPDRQGEMNIWIRSLPDGSERRITSCPGGDYQRPGPRTGAGSSFFSARGGNTDVWTVQVQDGALSPLTEDPALDTNPFYSPDGQWIAFRLGPERTVRGLAHARGR